MNSITQLRDILFETLNGVKDGTIKPEKAKNICDVAQVIINSANAETAFLKTISSNEHTGFMNKSIDSNTNLIASKKELNLGVSKNDPNEKKGFFELIPTVKPKVDFAADGIINIGELKIIGDSVYSGETEMELTNNEFELIYIIALKSPLIVRYSEIDAKISDNGDKRIFMDIFLSKINSNFSDRILFHRKGEGYFIKQVNNHTKTVPSIPSTLSKSIL